MDVADELMHGDIVVVRMGRGDEADTVSGAAARGTSTDGPGGARRDEIGRPDWQPLDLPETQSHAAPWRVAVQRRRIMLHDELARLSLSGAAEEERAALRTLLDDAGIACRTDVNIRKWWWGTEVERAWSALREVEERLIDLLPDAELAARATEAAAHGYAYLKSDDKRLLHLEALRVEAVKGDVSAPPAGLRSATAEVLRASHAAADRSNQEARYLRNRVLLASCVSVAFATMVVLLQRWLGGESLLDVPDGWTGRPWKFVVIVMLLGAVGALFTAIPAVSKIPSDFGPFNLPLQQALLKITFGPLVAVVGFAIVSTGVVEAGSPDTWPGVVLLAVALGAGQQAVTKYVDARADEILTAAAPTTDTAT